MAYEIKRDGRVYISGGYSMDATEKSINKGISKIKKENEGFKKELADLKKDNAGNKNGPMIEFYSTNINKNNSRINDLNQALGEVTSFSNSTSSKPSRGIGNTSDKPS